MDILITGKTILPRFRWIIIITNDNNNNNNNKVQYLKNCIFVQICFLYKRAKLHFN